MCRNTSESWIRSAEGMFKFQSNGFEVNGVCVEKNRMGNTTLLIMAVGIASRFGGGIKKLEPVGLHDEIIMDYFIYDAIEAGFNKIMFVILKGIEAYFHPGIPGERR